MKDRRRSCFSLPSPLIAAAVGVLCIAYVQLSHSATIPEGSSSATSTSTTTAGTKQPVRLTTSRIGKQRSEIPAGRMKASDIKACISKAFCEVNSASRTPNYAVNKEFFDLMNQIHALSDEELDSGSTSVEYDDDDDDDDDEDDDNNASASSEESSSERLRGYPPPPPPPPGYRRGRAMGNGTDTSSSSSGGNTTESTVASSTVKKAKHSNRKSEKKSKKKNKNGKVSGNGKMVKKYVNGTFISVPKRRSRLETEEEKAEKQDFVNRKQREMGQVNDLAALIRISADIGLTLRSPRKCRTLFNKCTMTHNEIVDLFNQTLIAVTTPSTHKPSSAPTTKRAKVTTTLAAAVTSIATPEDSSSPLSTVQQALTPTQQTSAATTLLSTSAPTTTTTVDDGNRSSKSRHDFSDEDVEYMTDTEIQPVQTYALFVNDAPEDAGKTVEEVNLHETFKQYANAFPMETALPGNIPSLRKRSNKKKSLKTSGRSSSTAKIAKRRHGSSEEDDDDDDEEEDDDIDLASTSLEEADGQKNGFRIESPYPGYRVNKGGPVDDEKSVESAEPSSGALKESSEGILPPLVQKQQPAKGKHVDEEEDEEDEESSEEDDIEDDHAGHGIPTKNTKKRKLSKSGTKGKITTSKRPSIMLDESSEEDELEAHDDQQSPPPWTPVYQMHTSEKKKQGYKKKQKGPYKGGEEFYDDAPAYHTPQSSSTSSFTNFLKKPWGGSSSNAGGGSHEIPGQAPAALSHESVFQDYPGHGQQHGHYAGGHGGPPGHGPSPYGNSQETGGVSEQKPGFFQSIMSWFTGGKQNGEHGAEGAYGSGQMHHPYGAPGGHSAQHDHQHGHYGGGHGSVENDDPQSQTGAPWPSQPDPAGVGHYGQSYKYRGYRKPASSEESEELMDEPALISKKGKKSKRRYRGRSDSIITSPPKKPSNPAKKSGPPPPVVIVPKDSKSGASAGSSSAGVYEPNHNYDKLIQADGGITSGSNLGKKMSASSTKENKRAKKAAVKPKNNQQKQQQKKKNQKQSERAAGHRTSRESGEDDDEAFSSEELFNQQVAKLKSGSTGVTLGGSNSGNLNAGGNSNGGVANKQNEGPSKPADGSDASFPSYFESMFGTEEKDKYKIKGKDDGSLLYGFDSLSSTLHATPVELPIIQTKKKSSSYKVNKNKKKKKNGNGGVLGQPVKFNNKEVIEEDQSSEEKKKK